MKTLLLLPLILPMFLHAQLPMKDGKVFYEKVDSCNLSADQLYNKTRLWLADNFKDSKNVIEIDDKEDGQIVGKGNFDFNYTYALTPVTSTCYFNIRIDMKDKKYRMQLYNFLIGDALNTISLDIYTTGKYKNQSKKILPPVQENVNKIMDDYKNYLNTTEEIF